MKKIDVEYDRKKCVGTRRCIEVAGDRFSFDGRHAVLQGSILKKGVSCLAVEVTSEQCEKLIQAAESCPVNAIQVKGRDNTLLVTTSVKHEGASEILAEYDDRKEFILDPAGYFLIRIDQLKQRIEVGFCDSRNTVTFKVTGKKPIDIYQTIINKVQLNIRKDHCAYLGRELQKAYIALQKGILYVQDDELAF